MYLPKQGHFAVLASYTLPNQEIKIDVTPTDTLKFYQVSQISLFAFWFTVLSKNTFCVFFVSFNLEQFFGLSPSFMLLTIIQAYHSLGQPSIITRFRTYILKKNIQKWYTTHTLYLPIIWYNPHLVKLMSTTFSTAKSLFFPLYLNRFYVELFW